MTTYTVPNKFAGTCAQCNERVAPEAGYRAAKPNESGQGPKWPMLCRPCKLGDTPTPVDPAPALDARPTFPLTDEQVRAVELALTGATVAIQAGAGTGKTSTLVAIGKATDRPLQFVAFNKSIVRDAAQKMPRNVTCSTMSSLAYQQVGVVHYKARLAKQPRVPGSQLAHRVGLGAFTVEYGEERIVLQPGKLMGIVRRAVDKFCYSADAEPGLQHFEYVEGIDAPTATGRSYGNNDQLARFLLPTVQAVWADLVNVGGWLPFFSLTHVEKIWQLGVHGKPVVPGTGILFDEAQDANPVYLDVVRQQGKQVIYVGDSQQQINEWRGCVNAMEEVSGEDTCYLTHSFRFGTEVAEVANRVLDRIDGAVLRLTGRGAAGMVGPRETHDAVLCRTNAMAMQVTLDALGRGQQPFLVGGGGEVEYFARSAAQLQETGSTDHPDLAWASSWGQVQAYVENEPDGADLQLLVKLVDDFGVEAILRAVANPVAEADADVVISTAHKAKGREWDSVRLAGDFSDARITAPADLRLLYVAVTRARLHLDYSGCPAMLAIDEEAGVAA